MSAPIILVPGFWLGAWAWDEVAGLLRGEGVAVSPGPHMGSVGDYRVEADPPLRPGGSESAAPADDARFGKVEDA